MENKIYKTVSIRANMAPIMKKVTKSKQTGTESITKTKGFIKKEEYTEEKPIFEQYDEMVPTGEHSDTYINIEEFSTRIMDACNKLHEEGYEIVNMSDIIDGRYKYETEGGSLSDGGWGYGFGYSVTDGVIITGKLRNI